MDPKETAQRDLASLTAEISELIENVTSKDARLKCLRHLLRRVIRENMKMPIVFEAKQEEIEEFQSKMSEYRKQVEELIDTEEETLLKEDVQRLQMQVDTLKTSNKGN